MILPQHMRASATPLSETIELPDYGDGRGTYYRALDTFVSRPAVHEFVVCAGPRYEAEQVAALVAGRDLGEAIDATTDHALLVLLGQYARHLGLIKKLEAAPISQRTREHTPQTKLIQLLVGVLAGQEYLQDFNEGAQPLVKDKAVIAAWEQPAFAHYSGVSRTLEAADEQTLQAVSEALQRVSQPFTTSSRGWVDAEVLALVQQGRPLVLDVDLTGRPVSPTSTTFPEADFGWMNDDVRKGYQAAITSLSGGPCQRLLLSSQRYPGHTGSAECLQAAMRKMEQVLGFHPRRRTGLVQARLQTLRSAKIEPAQAALERKRARRRELFDKLQAARAEGELAAQAEVTRLAAEYAAHGWVEKPHSKLAGARRRLTSIQKQQQRAGRDLRTNAARLTKLEHRLTDLLAQESALLDWLAELEADNATLQNPWTLVVRIDAGFSTDENLTWLIEMGYLVYTKAYNAQITAKLRRQISPTAKWKRVGRNAEAVHLPGQQIAACPYPLETLLVRYHLPTGMRYTTLLYYGDQPPPTDLKTWFAAYNARQTIEAGIKEGKGVFPIRRPWVRSPIGLQLQELFSLFAANFVRWAARWARQIVRQANRLLSEALTEVKTLVKIVAKARARLVHNTLGRVLIFDEYGPFAGSQFLLSGLMAYQRVLPLFNNSNFLPD